MANLELIIEEKIDYRLKELRSIYPSLEISAIVITEGNIDDELLNIIKSKNVEIVKSYPFMRTIKVRGKIKDILELSSINRVKYLMLDEILSKSS
jgi:hypothetical protein